jgi:hypothetical protein
MYRAKDTGGVVSSTATNEVWVDATEWVFPRRMVLALACARGGLCLGSGASP